MQSQVFRACEKDTKFTLPKSSPRVFITNRVLRLHFTFVFLFFLRRFGFWAEERGARILASRIILPSSSQPQRARLSDNKMCLGQEININGVSISFRLLSFIKECQWVVRHFTPLLISGERARVMRAPLKQKLVCSRAAPTDSFC